MSLPRRTLLAAALVLAPVATVGPARAQDAAATAPVQALVQALTQAMQAGPRTPFPQRFNIIAAGVDRAFDLPAVLSASVGPRFASLPPDQQTALLDVFRKFTVASYAGNFDNAEDGRLEVLANQRTVGQDLVVSTRIVPRTGEPTNIDYVMRRGAQGWRAVDVLLNGSISQNAVKRSDFRSLVGSSAQSLIESLRRKVAELSGGTMN